MRLIGMLLLLVSVQVFAEVREIAPSSTDINIQQKRGPHLAYFDPQSKGNGLLLLSFGGTGSKPSDLAFIDERAVKAGYNVLAVDYPNKVVSTTCRKSSDPNCAQRFREEVIKGIPYKTEPEDEVVDKKNEIENRVRALLRTMRSGKDAARWAPYLKKNGEVDWSKIVVIGHSQGAGIAAYLAKLHKVHGAIIIAGPQDSHEVTGPAPWLKSQFESDKSRLLFFMHERDHYQYENEVQLKAARAILGTDAAVTDAADPKGNAQILMSRTHKGEVYDAHMRIISEEYQALYDYLLKRAADGPAGGASAGAAVGNAVVK